MKLTQDTMGANSIKALFFYKKLGFEIQTQDSKIVTIDSQTCIEINPKRTAWVCIQLYQSRWGKTLLQLKDRTPIIKTE